MMTVILHPHIVGLFWDEKIDDRLSDHKFPCRLAAAVGAFTWKSATTFAAESRIPLIPRLPQIHQVHHFPA